MKSIIFNFLVLYTFSLFSQNQSTLIDNIKKDSNFLSKNKDIKKYVSKKEITSQQLSYSFHTYAKLLYKENRIDECFKYLYQAIQIRRESNDLVALKKSLFNLGIYKRKLGDYYASITALNDLIDLPLEDRLRIKAYSELILVYKKLGDYEKCFRYFKKIEKFHLANNNFKELCKSYLHISGVYNSMDYNNNDLTIWYLKKANALEKYVDSRDKYIINLSFGNVYEDLKNKNLALKHYNKALDISFKRKDSNAIALLHNNIGYLYLEDSLYDISFEYLNKGFIFAAGNARRKASLNRNLAEYYLKVANYKKAQKVYEKALNLFLFQEANTTKQINLEAVENSPNQVKALNCLIRRGKFWYSWYQYEPNTELLKKALADFQLADRIIDAISLNTVERVSKLFWREKGANLYIQAIAVCNELQLADLAYYFMEKNKALLLLEHVNDERAKLVSKLPEQLVAKDYSYRQQITQASNSPDLLFDLKSNYSRFKDSLATAYPNYARLRKQLPMLSLQEHQQQFVSNQEATLQFIVNTDKAFGLVITNNSTDLYPIKNVANLTRELIALREKLQNPFITQKEVLNYNKQAYIIFNTLLPAAVYQKIKGKKLTIATDGNLQNIPFEALVTQDHTSIKNIPYFISTNQIDYVYSFSYLNSNNKVLRTPKKHFLGLAPKNFQDNSLSVLTNSVKEVNTINIIFNDQVYTEKKATKNQFLVDFNQYNIVHLATHSGLNEQTNPWLAFYDAKVSLDEIYATKNQADLVVLSACKTSQGMLKSGEGVMSLARGFFFSGTNTVVSSLWNLNDKTTEKIMVNFYEKLNSGSSKSEALHQAKLDYINNNSGSEASPFYWSSFILIGDGTGVLESFSISSLYPIIGLFLLVLFIGLIYFLKKNE